MQQGILGRHQTPSVATERATLTRSALTGRASTTNKRETRKCTYPNLTARKIAPRPSLS